jgi:hypothetical protein
MAMIAPECQLEEAHVTKLRDLKYEYRPDIRDRATLEANFRVKFEALNRVTLTDGEFQRLLDEIVTPDVYEAARSLRNREAFIRDDGTLLNYTLVNIRDWCKNAFEVVNQLRINTDNSHHRYDVILLINGVPVVQIELKTLGISPRRAMEQTFIITSFALDGCSDDHAGHGDRHHGVALRMNPTPRTVRIIGASFGPVMLAMPGMRPRRANLAPDAARTLRLRLSAPFIDRSWLRHVPCAVEKTVAVGLAWRGIFLVSVEWLALIRPHVPAVDASNDCHGAGWSGVHRGQQRRPVLCTETIAHRLSIGILIEGIKRHALGVDQRPALRRFGRPKRLCRCGR